jgi:hypothetical protein
MFQLEASKNYSFNDVVHLHSFSYVSAISWLLKHLMETRWKYPERARDQFRGFERATFEPANVRPRGELCPLPR